MTENPPKIPAFVGMLPRESEIRELSLREFLAGELMAARTTVERALLAELIMDVPGTLKLIG